MSKTNEENLDLEEDEILDKAIRYVVAHSRGSTYSYPAEGSSKNFKQSIRKRAEKIFVEDGSIMYRKKKGVLVRIIQSGAEQSRILEMCHSDPTSGHFGVKKTFNRLSERFYWKGMYKDVENLVATCNHCQHMNKKVRKYSSA